VGTFPIKSIFAFTLAVALLGLNPNHAAAADDYIIVTSTDDGHGLYSYTFSPGPTDLYFTLGTIEIQSHGILGTTQPPGWTASIDTNNFVQWNYLTNEYLPLTNSVTFTIQSSYPVPRVYDDAHYPSQMTEGIMLLIGYADPGFQMELGGGYGTFAYAGPSTNGAPTLSLQTVDTNVIVGWHAAAIGHVLEMSTNLAQTNWTPLTNVVLVGHSNFVTVPLVSGPQFFRTVNTNAP
jgi:hypothetical protein